MSGPDRQDSTGRGQAQSAADIRRKRLAAQLRANLKKRKAQARSRADRDRQDGGPPETEGSPQAL